MDPDTTTHDWDVVIVGAGPVGGHTANLLSTRGHRVLLLEEHNEIGRPFQCAGLVTPNAMKQVGLYETILEEVDGALIHGPSGTLVPVGTDGTVRTYVVCRKLFDEAVVKQSMVSGATLWLNSKPISAEAHSEGVDLLIARDGNEISISTKLLIGCDGAHSWTRRFFKMGRPKELMVGFQTEVVGYQYRKRWLEMYSGSEIAPGFFAWVIPSGNDSCRIGLWSTADRLDGRSIEECYANLLNHPLWKERFAGIKETARYCGPVPSGMIRKAYKNRVLLIGDAAGMAKPTTGGGIGPGFEQINGIVDRLSTAVSHNLLSEDELKSIAKSHFEKMRKEQNRARSLRNLLVSDCEDEELDSHFEQFAKPEVIQLINAIGDIEKPVPLGMALLKKVPAFRKLALKAGMKMIFS
ncbi:MAG TPA: geranylgeranyl reductase family protein [Candidatus Poseidoniaceae archaeon]|nr:MAG TPA: geranylgeranyl reductase family protein [Candidatus Poseidoniales archaeon]HII45436.1 geranylgeranyl reductase family protein [Candidatus Poseidoniaceae archaeon]